MSQLINPKISVHPGISEFRLSEIISSFSYALDITEGQPEGHATRSCIVGLRIADAIGVSQQQQAALFYALLLKDLGCSSNAAKMCWLFKADDRVIKREIKLVDWCSLLKTAMFSLQRVSPGASFANRVWQVMKMAADKRDTSRSLIKVRCERGAGIARMIGFPEDTARAIQCLDEHWDGQGHPLGLARDEIPLAARICSLAQTVEVFAREYDLATARKIAERRSGSWFDPELVQAFLSIADQELELDLQHNNPRELLTSLQPEDSLLEPDDATVDRIANSFARVIDAKSPWTLRHSDGVAEIAEGIARTLGWSEAKQREIRHAGLLHDIGKLGVSNLILDKPGKLTDPEFEQMKNHATHSRRILERIKCFATLADYASAHHERLDGNGYDRGLEGDMIPVEARVLAVADVCEALSADRPYRDSMPNEKIISILKKDSGTAFCPQIVDAFLHFQNETGLFERLRERTVASSPKEL